jgi:hypothetical protein
MQLTYVVEKASLNKPRNNIQVRSATSQAAFSQNTLGTKP